MAMVPNRPAAMMRRATRYSLVADIGISLLFFLLGFHLIALILFVAGLGVTAFVYYNFSQVMKTRGMR